MTTSVGEYKNALKITVKENTLSEKTPQSDINWRSVGWKNTWSLINQEVLKDAHGQKESIETIFKDLGKMIARPCKSIERVEKKKTEQTYENFFKVTSDFAAFRVNCEVKEIKEKIDVISKVVKANQGEMYVRGSAFDRTFIDKTGNYKDITQYVMCI